MPRIFDNIALDLLPALREPWESPSSLLMMKTFYLSFPKVQTLSGQLSWSHCRAALDQ